MREQTNQMTGNNSTVSRRQFGTAAGVAAMAAGTPAVALAKGSKAVGDLGETIVSFDSASGTVDGFFVHPVKGAHPGVLSWRDGSGLGPVSRAEARRLAKQGYSVLVLNRDGGDAPLIEADATAAVAWLEDQKQVDPKRGVGTPDWAEQRLVPKHRV